MIDLKGKTLGRYHLIEPLGEGGMAVVYKAYDATLERNVAIKIIRTGQGDDESFLRRFQREARALAQLDHPYILKVLDYGEQDGMPYLVMPFLTGGTLKQRMGKPVSAAEAARILGPIACALEYAHQQGVIHRDVKPANILITQSGAPILSDFGIAKIVQSDDSTQLTGTGVGIGTPDYMAPEQWLGTTDARTDIYALGVVFYEMITGRRPYTADTPAAVLLKHMQDPLPRPRDFVANVPEAAEQVVFRSMAKEPANRYADMGQMAAALERLAVEAPTGESAANQPAAAQPQSSSANWPTLLNQRMAEPRPSPLPTVPERPVQPTGPQPRRKLNLVAVMIGLIALGLTLCVVVFGVIAAFNFNTIRQTLLAQQTIATEVATEGPTAVAGEANPTNPAPTDTQTPTQVQPTATTEPARPTPTTAPPTPEPPGATPTARPPVTKIEGLPDDIPIFVDNNGDLITSITAQMDLYMYTTQKPVKEVEAFFRKEMEAKGWQVDSTMTMTAQDSVILSYSKKTRTVMLNIAQVDSGNGLQTTVQVIIQKQ